MFPSQQRLLGKGSMRVMLSQDTYKLNLRVLQELVEIGIVFCIGVIDRTMRFTLFRSGSTLIEGVDHKVGVGSDIWEMIYPCGVTVAYKSDFEWFRHDLEEV